MMKLSTMLAVDRAVDRHGKSLIAEQLLNPWEHDRDSVTFFRASANFIYLFHKAGKRFFLRFAADSERTREAIEAEIDILQWVAARGITVTPPIESRNGNFVETVETDLGTFHGVVFGGLDGSQLEFENLDEDHFWQWGAALGMLHSALKKYTGPGLSLRSTWRDHLELVRTYLPQEQSSVWPEFEQIASWLETLPVSPDSYGLIHCDFELDNLYWQERTIAIGDFDDCSRAWYGMDIAFALRDLFRYHIDLNSRSFLAFVRGYETEHGLDAELVSQLPLFLRMAKLLTYARIVRSMDLLPQIEDPAWLQALRVKLERWLDGYRASL
jgi:Ser/Thr protein kinase RdoA (MazF antagonist)